ncbi:hypothetical protein ACKWTF_015823 [Chironomus riparius]
MLDSIVFVIFSTIYIASAVIFHKSLTADQNLPNSICRITYDVTSSKSDTQDILFGNLDSQTWSSTVNDIVKCIDNGAAVVVADLKTIIKNKNFRKASVIILALNQANEVSLRVVYIFCNTKIVFKLILSVNFSETYLLQINRARSSN